MVKINVGLIGYGMAGRIFHAPLIAHLPELELRMIRETREKNVLEVKCRYPNAELVDEASAIINRPEIDLVVVAAPNRFHYALAKEALLAGKHVVVEKPFTVTTAEADELIELSAEKGKVLSIYQNRRWDSDFLTVKKVIGSKMLGRLVEFESHYDRFRNSLRENTWKEDGIRGTGILYDLGSHLIDQAQVLFGLPEAVTADIRSQRDGSQIADNFELILHYKHLKVTLKSGMLVKEPIPKYIVCGTEGAFVKYGMDVQEATLNQEAMSLSDEDWGREPESIWGTLNTSYKGLNFRGKIESERGNYLGYYQNIYKAIIGEEPVKVKPEQARNTIRIIELAMESHETKRTVPFIA